MAEDEKVVEGEVVNSDSTASKYATDDNVKYASYGSLGLGLAGLLGMCCGGACCLPLPILGAVLGYWAKDKGDNVELQKYAKWGMYLSLIVIVLLILWTICSLVLNLATIPFSNYSDYGNMNY